MINTDNYYSKTSGLDFSTLPPALQKGHEFVDKVTMKGESWTSYESSPTIQKVIDEYFKKLSEHLPEKSEAKKERKEEKKEKEKSVHPKKEKVKNERVQKVKTETKEDVELVERIPDELRFMKRYIKLHNKKKTKEELLRFINALQKAILERRIRKDSAWSKQINYMQENLLKVYNGMKGRSIEIEISPKTWAEFKKEIEGEKEFKSIQFIKRYVNLHGKIGIKEKAKKLFEQINRAVKKRKIEKGDKYATKLNQIWLSLQDFLADKSKKTLPMNSAELNGLMGFLGKCNCGLNGVEDEDEGESESGNKLMSSMDFADMEFDSIGLKDKWRELMGDPAPGFTAMVFGKPKTGKSYLCVEFAGYLARNHGKVLYVAREEGLDKTLQIKLNDKNVKHENLFVSDFLPEDLSEYDFIFLDSVNKLGLSAKDLDVLRKSNPGKSFIFVFQTTKDGNFRGKNEFQHDVDIVIEVAEKGKAVQFGRYNQGGEMSIFEG
ncbi:MAG: hypothetical protein HY840_02875 [Bacteroidetes bacterium]|nr:hypothetical protein [Bacteroidota bacterium]